jgi:HemY protein
MLLPFLTVLMIGTLYIVGVMLLRNSQDLIILWGQEYTLETSSFTLIVGLIVAFIVGYLLLAGLYWLITLPSKLKQRKLLKRQIVSQIGIKKGLVNMLEGHWAEGEKNLLENVDYSDNPLLNYLAAARASQMQEQYHKRDEYLKKASSFGEDAEIAVAVSQATMQFDIGQMEQARATLTHLREISPEHPFPNQLLAKVYTKQEDWKQLVDLIPELLPTAETELQRKKYQSYMESAVKGLLETTSGKQDISALELIWQKLPDEVKQAPYAVIAYASALTNAGAGELAASLLEEQLSSNPSRGMYTCYGTIQHHSPEAALVKAKTWELRDGQDSALLLCLARLENQCGNQSASADYYESALTLVPDQQVYYEFAELLWTMGDEENSSRCTRQGLRYCVQGKARPFKRN